MVKLTIEPAKGTPLTLETVAAWCASKNPMMPKPRVRALLTQLGFGSIRKFVECDRERLKNLCMQYQTYLGERTILVSAHEQLPSMTDDQVAEDIHPTNLTHLISGCSRRTLGAVAAWCAQHNKAVSEHRVRDLLTLLRLGSYYSFVDCDREDLKVEMEKSMTKLSERYVMLLAHDEFTDLFGNPARVVDKKRARDDEVTTQELSPKMPKPAAMPATTAATEDAARPDAEPAVKTEAVATSACA